MGRRRKDPEQAGWKKKLHPVFFALAELNQEFERRWAKMQDAWRREREEAGAGATDVQNELAARVARETNQFDKWCEQKLADINRRHTHVPYDPSTYSYLTLDPPVSDSEGIWEYIHFHRHGESLRATGTKDAQGDLNAWDKISRTERDFRILAFAKGPIAPFQGDVVHRQLLELVICYERERLTAEELAQCFDKYCGCEKENHDADALRKMRDRFEVELRAE